MSKVTSFLSSALNKFKNFLSDLVDRQKPDAKKFIHDQIDAFYKSVDQVTEVATIAKLQNYLQSRVGDSKLGGQIVGRLAQLIAIGIATGAIDLGLDSADALTRVELTKLEGYINRQIDSVQLF